MLAESGCPEGLVALIERCWSDDVGQRPVFAELIVELHCLSSTTGNSDVEPVDAQAEIVCVSTYLCIRLYHVMSVYMCKHIARHMSTHMSVAVHKINTHKHLAGAEFCGPGFFGEPACRLRT